MTKNPDKLEPQDRSDNETEQSELSLKQKIIREVKVVLVIIILVFTFRSICYEPFKIPSGSMIPTLLIGDFILVNKMSYGLKVPFSDWFTDPIYITTPHYPERGDIIVFKYPVDPSLNYIKRVIGLPGDTVEMKDKIVYINGSPILPKPIDGKKIMEDMDEKFKNVHFKFFQEKIGEHENVYQIDEDSYLKSDFDKIIVPKDSFFVMGDNRDFSADSRYWGFVPFKNIRGKAVRIWFSLSLPYSENGFKFRPWRIGHKLE